MSRKFTPISSTAILSGLVSERIDDTRFFDDNADMFEMTVRNPQMRGRLTEFADVSTLTKAGENRPRLMTDRNKQDQTRSDLNTIVAANVHGCTVVAENEWDSAEIQSSENRPSVLA